MMQIIAFYEPSTGIPWCLWLFVVLSFLIALLLPFVIRFGILQRPVINIWAATLLALVSGFVIIVFSRILFPITISISNFLFVAACIYSYWILHIGYRKYCTKKAVENETDNTHENEDEQ